MEISYIVKAPCTLNGSTWTLTYQADEKTKRIYSNSGIFGFISDYFNYNSTRIYLTFAAAQEGVTASSCVGKRVQYTTGYEAYDSHSANDKFYQVLVQTYHKQLKVTYGSTTETKNDSTCVYHDGVAQGSGNIKFTAPSISNYSFTNFADGSEGSISGQSVTFSYSNSDQSATAVYSPNFTIKFNKNNNSASGTMNNQSFVSGVSKNLTANKFTLENHDFEKWNTKSDGSGLSYNNKEDGSGILSALSKSAGSTITLYAQWKGNVSYTVTYNANGGGGSMDPTPNPTTIAAGSTGTVSSLNFTAPSGTRKYPNGPYWKDKDDNEWAVDTQIDNSAGKGGSLTLYAQWQTWLPYTVTYNANGGGGSMSPTVVDAGVSGNVAALNFTAPSGTRKYPNGPYWKDGDGNEWVVNTIINNQSGAGGSLTLYAQWQTWTTKTVNFDANGGSGNQSAITINPGENASMPSGSAVAFTKNECAFVKWSSSSAGYDYITSVSNTNGEGGTTTLYAIWKDWKPFVIKYYDRKGNLAYTQTIEAGVDGFIANGKGGETGYNFEGYSLSSGGERDTRYDPNTPIYNVSGVGGSLNLYAVVTPKTYFNAVLLDNVGGTPASSTITVTYDATFPNISAIPIKAGYSFDGYYAESDGKGTQYVNYAGTGINAWKIDGGGTVYANWGRIRHEITISRTGSVEGTPSIKITGDYVDITSTSTPVVFNGAEGSTYSLTISFNEAFYARKYVPSLDGTAFTKNGDYAYTSSITVGTDGASHTVTFAEVPTYTLTSSISKNQRIADASDPTISFSPTPDNGTDLWFEQLITASITDLDPKTTLASWSAINTATGQSYKTQESPDDYSFTIGCNTRFNASLVPKKLTTLSCQLHQSSSSVGAEVSVEDTNPYVSGEYHAGDTAVFTASEVSGYEFGDWVDAEGTTVSTERIYTTTITKDTTLYARYKVNVTATLVAATGASGIVSVNGTSGASSVTAGVILGSQCTISCTTENFFAGWYSNAQHSTLLPYSQTHSFTVTEASTAYAYVTSEAFYNYLAFYNYNQTEEVYDSTLGTWTVSGPSDGDVTAITKAEYETGTGLTALANGTFVKVLGIKTVSVAVAGTNPEKGFAVINVYAAESTIGEPIGSYSTASFSASINSPRIYRASWGQPAPKTITVGYCTGSSGHGTATVNGLASASVSQGDTCTFVASPVNGYKFSGWYASADGTGLMSTSRTYIFTVDYERTVYARFDQDRNAICEWEGSSVNKRMRWVSKTFVSARPFAPTSMRVDALGYVPSGDLRVKLGMFSSPDSDESDTVELNNITEQGMRRVPRMRQEKYMKVTIENNAEVDALVVGTSAMGVIV